MSSSKNPPQQWLHIPIQAGLVASVKSAVHKASTAMVNFNVSNIHASCFFCQLLISTNSSVLHRYYYSQTFECLRQLINNVFCLTILIPQFFAIVLYIFLTV